MRCRISLAPHTSSTTLHHFPGNHRSAFFQYELVLPVLDCHIHGKYSVCSLVTNWFFLSWCFEIYPHCIYFYCCCCLVPKLCLTLLWPYGLEPSRLICWGDFPGKNIGVGCHFLLQGIFLTQESNPHLLHWQVDSWPLSHWVLFHCMSISQLIYFLVGHFESFPGFGCFEYIFHIHFCASLLWT